MKVHNLTYPSQTLAATDFQQRIADKNNSNSTAISENPTVFGESSSQNSTKKDSKIPQPSITRVEQWIQEWKQGIMRIEAGVY